MSSAPPLAADRSAHAALAVPLHDGPRWPWRLWLFPLIGFLAANVWLIGYGGDRWIADHVYAWEGGRWALRNSFATTTLIHETGKALSILAWLVVVAMAIAANRMPRLRPWRGPLVRLALSLLLATMLVTTLKHLTRMDCPWDLRAYGGSRPYIDLFTARPAGLKAGGCFPAGQASAGYGWVALYFFFLPLRPRWRYLGLAIGLAAGALFGIAQQLRGAHFMSHDVWTLMICWITALLLYGMWPSRQAIERRHDVSSAPTSSGAPHTARARTA